MKGNLISGVMLSSIFSGVRDPRNGRIISHALVHRVFNQVGTISFVQGGEPKKGSKGVQMMKDDEVTRDAKIKTQTERGLNVLISSDGTYAELYAPISPKAKANAKPEVQKVDEAKPTAGK